MKSRFNTHLNRCAITADLSQVITIFTLIWPESFFGRELQLQSKVWQKASWHPRETHQMLVPKLLSICQQLTVLWAANHLWAWPKLSNVLIYNPRHIFPVTRKWTSRRLSGKNRVRTKRMGWFCRFQLNWDSSFHELSLPHNVLLSQGTPVSSCRRPSPLDGTE